MYFLCIFPFVPNGLLGLSEKHIGFNYLQENEAFTRQMATKSRKIVMDAEHGEKWIVLII